MGERCMCGDTECPSCGTAQGFGDDGWAEDRRVCREALQQREKAEGGDLPVSAKIVFADFALEKLPDALDRIEELEREAKYRKRQAEAYCRAVGDRSERIAELEAENARLRDSLAIQRGLADEASDRDEDRIAKLEAENKWLKCEIIDCPDCGGAGEELKTENARLREERDRYRDLRRASMGEHSRYEVLLDAVRLVAEGGVINNIREWAIHTLKAHRNVVADYGKMAPFVVFNGMDGEHSKGIVFANMDTGLVVNAPDWWEQYTLDAINQAFYRFAMVCSDKDSQKKNEQLRCVIQELIHTTALNPEDASIGRTDFHSGTDCCWVTREELAAEFKEYCEVQENSFDHSGGWRRHVYFIDYYGKGLDRIVQCIHHKNDKGIV